MTEDGPYPRDVRDRLERMCQRTQGVLWIELGFILEDARLLDMTAADLKALWEEISVQVARA